MRLPMRDGEVDTAEFSAMVDAFLDSGFCYFDTAHGYLGTKSEPALRACLTSRYPRERYFLADKLSGSFFTCQEDIRPLFESQLAACGVDYFDVYLMHSQSAENFAFYKKCRAYETALALKAEGKIRRFGISFHDSAAVLEQILTEYPAVELVQIQYNYMDVDDPVVESGRCLDVCRRHGKPVIVMEPVKGGNLAALPDDARAPLDALHGGSPASYAIRYAAGTQGVVLVLSGMSSLAQLRDNIGFMRQFEPLSAAERDAIERVRGIFKSKNLIPCTACRYCIDGCPQHIAIPDVFACMNAKENFHSRNTSYYYNDVLTAHSGKASSCVQCGKCERICPQHLPIRSLLKAAAAAFEEPQQ